MDTGYRFHSWFVDDYGWARMSLPGAALTLCSLPLFLAPGNAALILMCTVLLSASMNHQYGEHARGRFACFGNSEVGGGRDVLTSAGRLLDRHPRGVAAVPGVLLPREVRGDRVRLCAGVRHPDKRGTHAIGARRCEGTTPASPGRSSCTSLGGYSCWSTSMALSGPPSRSTGSSFWSGWCCTRSS